jgi:hypothetical protein
MKTVLLTTTTLVAVALLATACDNSPVEVEPTREPQLSVYGSGDKGAIVINLGEASEPYSSRCRISGRSTNDVTVVATPNGGANFSCHFDEFPAAPDFGPGAAVFQGWRCTLNSKVGFEGETYNTVFTLAENNRAHAKCTFQGQFSRGRR